MSDSVNAMVKDGNYWDILSRHKTIAAAQESCRRHLRMTRLTAAGG